MILALVFGYLAGGVPTTDWIAAVRGLDLRSAGSGNPGANNARRVGGAALGVVVLLVEVAKGAAVVLITSTIDGSLVPAAAAAAVAGNIWNPYRRLSGGQGLGITLGVLIAGWPIVVPAVLLVMIVVAIVLRRVPAAALAAVGVILVSAVAWRRWSLPIAWGVESDLVPWLAAGLAVVLLPKQLRNLLIDRRRRRRAATG